MRENSGFIVLAMGLLLVCLLIIPFIPSFKVPVVLEFIARFHPLILHFPIVAVLLIALLEVFHSFKVIQFNEGVRGVLILLAMLSAVAAVLTGFLLYQSGGYMGELVSWHFYGGVVSGVLILITAIAYLYFIRNKQFRLIYLSCLSLTVIIVSATSHLGGSLTHGEDFLTEPIERFRLKAAADIKDKEDLIVFDDVVMAFLDVKCKSCHNQNKMKGDYSMMSYDLLVKGGESNLRAVVSSEANNSELLKRVLLPSDHEDHMPPEGKTPLSALEIEILKGWIGQGASPVQKVGELEDVQLAESIDSYLPELTTHFIRQYQSKEELAIIEKELTKVTATLGLEIEQYEENNEPFFSLSMTFPPPYITDESLKKLSPYFSYFKKVSLAASDISDDALYLISQMKNLKELYLQKTKTTSAGLVYLRELEALEILNLSYTHIDDAGIIQLTSFPALQKVYINGNDVSTQVAEAANKAKPNLQIMMEEGPYY